MRGLGQCGMQESKQYEPNATRISFGNLHAVLCGHKGGNTSTHTRRLSLAYLTLHLSSNERKTCWQLPEYT